MEESRPPRTVYVESTIPNAYFSERTEPKMVARREWTREWWEQRSGYRLVSSRATLLEVSSGVHPNQQEKIAFVRGLPFVALETGVEETAAEYIRQKLMPADPAGDALHLALASHHECDFLLT